MTDDGAAGHDGVAARGVAGSGVADDTKATAARPLHSPAQAWLRVLWSAAVLALAVAYVSQFGNYTATELLFPELVALPLVVLSVGVLGWEVAAWWRSRPKHVGKFRPGLPPAVLGFALGSVYVLLLPIAGFTIDSAGLIVVGPVVLGYPIRRLWLLGLLAIVTVVVVDGVFKFAGGTPLPRGLL